MLQNFHGSPMLNQSGAVSAVMMELTAWAGPVLLDGHSDAARC